MQLVKLPFLIEFPQGVNHSERFQNLARVSDRRPQFQAAQHHFAQPFAAGVIQGGVAKCIDILKAGFEVLQDLAEVAEPNAYST